MAWQPSLYYRVGDATAPDMSDGRPALIVHCCNNIGVWGAGFVMALSARWPAAEQAYLSWYHDPPADNPFQLGQVQFVPVQPNITVANLIGQRGIAGRSAVPPIRYAAIKLGLNRVRDHALDNGAHVHMPRMGAGLAGGRWEEIERIIVDWLCQFGIPVTVYDLP